MQCFAGLPMVNYTECSIPFTFGGMLYSDCARLNLDKSCDVRYCLMFDRRIVVCNPHNGSYPYSKNYYSKSFRNSVTEAVGITVIKNITVGSRLLPALVINNWIIIQQRIDGNISFYQNWETYKQG